MMNDDRRCDYKVVQMQALGERGLTVDQIIERVLVGRTTEQAYDYKPQTTASISTPPQHMWNYQLQQQQTQLKSRLKQLQQQYKVQQQHKRMQMKYQQELESVKGQLAEVLQLNIQLQNSINAVRIQTAQQHSPCPQKQQGQAGKQQKRNHKSKQSTLKRKTPHKQTSPYKPEQESSHQHNKAVDCNIPYLDRQSHPRHQPERQTRLQALRGILARQQGVIESYARKREQLGDSESGIASTSRFRAAISRPASQSTLAAGSIVKVRRVG